MIKAMYVHIPFCNNICSYCDFPKIYYQEDLIDKYLDTLNYELEKVYKKEMIDTIYIGGGTPSSLSLNQTIKLFEILKKVKKSKNIEFTIEANFDSITEEKLDLYKKYGINRISFGLETTCNKHLNFLDRTLSKKKVKQVIDYAKKRGIKNINIDLMYGMPKETVDELEQDLDFILSLDITHISTYSLIIEEHTKLFINNIENIDEDLDYKMYEVIRKKLKENNFYQYEISNFSKKGYESRHNLTYWNNEEYYGIGLGASSYINNKRITNTRSINKYLERKFIYTEEKLTIDDKCIYEMILGLRKIKGIKKEEFFKKYNCHIEEKFDIMNLKDKKLLEENNGYIFIPQDKLYIQNEILLSFVGGSSNGKRK